MKILPTPAALRVWPSCRIRVSSSSKLITNSFVWKQRKKDKNCKFEMQTISEIRLYNNWNNISGMHGQNYWELILRSIPNSETGLKGIKWFSCWNTSWFKVSVQILISFIFPHRHHATTIEGSYIKVEDKIVRSLWKCHFLKYSSRADHNIF